jgi:hypothetical protein
MCRLISGLFVVAVAFASGGSTYADEATPSQAMQTFEKLKGFAGEWIGKSTKGWEDTSTVKVVAGGSVVVEESFGAHPNETMYTMYYMDGDRLLLTHYCVAQNQPRLVASEFSANGDTVTFTFLDGTGMASRDVGHMDKCRIVFVDDDHNTTQWTWYQKGKEDWMEEILNQRVKK